jgi:hypothetical protein
MTRFAEKTEVSSTKSRDEIERTLTRYGATGFMYGVERRESGHRLRRQEPAHQIHPADARPEGA